MFTDTSILETDTLCRMLVVVFLVPIHVLLFRTRIRPLQNVTRIIVLHAIIITAGIAEKLRKSIHLQILNHIGSDVKQRPLSRILTTNIMKMMLREKHRASSTMITIRGFLQPHVALYHSGLVISSALSTAIVACIHDTY